VVHHGAALARESGQPALAEAVASGDIDMLPGRLPILLGYALKLTLAPWEVQEEDLAPMRAAGLSDRDIVDANQVVGYYNYVNRVADGLGVELEPRWPPDLRRPRTYAVRKRWRAARPQG
jgi:uncharacterized peroxidase-related enzyme